MTKPSAIPQDVVNLPKSPPVRQPSPTVDFVRDHPGLVVAGGLAIGLVAGALLSRGSGRKLAKRAVALAEIAGTAGLAFGRDALEKAESAGHTLKERSETLGEKAGATLKRQGEALSHTAGKLADPADEALESVQDAAAKLLRNVIDLAGRLRR